MRYWWVNQNQTFAQEVNGGYLWSPQTKANGNINPFYEYMRLVAPSDLIFSFQGTFIRAIGMATSSCYPAPKPAEFGSTGPNWNLVGWRVDVNYTRLHNQIRPAAHLDQLRPVLPRRYSPLQYKSGHGNQGVYLTRVPTLMADALMQLIGDEAEVIRRLTLHDYISDYADAAVGLAEWEEHLIKSIETDTSLADTERMSIVLARRGQGAFKQNVLQHEHQCRVTGVARIEHLRASHIKPWRNCAKEPLKHSARSAFCSEKTQIVCGGTSDSSRSYGLVMPCMSCGFSGETHTGRAFARSPPRLGTLIWNDQTTLAQAKPEPLAKAPSRPCRVIQRFLIPRKDFQATTDYY